MASKEATVEESKPTTEDVTKLLSNIATNTAALVSAPLFLPGVERVTRPILKTAIRAGLATADLVGSPSTWLERASKRAEDSLGAVRAHWSEILDEAKHEHTRAVEEHRHREQPGESSGVARTRTHGRQPKSGDGEHAG